MSSACADWQRSRYGWAVDRADVHPLADVIKGLEVAIEHYSEPGGKIILPTPAYMPFLTVPPAMGREIIDIPLAHADGPADGEYTIDLEALDAAFAEGGRLLILCNPYNPVGRVFRPGELLGDRRGGPAARRAGVLRRDPRPAGLRRWRPRALRLDLTGAGRPHVTATSASKAWNLPGLKCAQIIISNDADRETWEEIGRMASHGAANLGVLANTTAYRDGGPWLDSVVELPGRNRRLLGRPARRPTARDRLRRAARHLHRLAGLPRPRPGVAGRLLPGAGRRVLTDGADCGSPGFVRLIFATPRAILTEAVTRMGSAVHSA